MPNASEDFRILKETQDIYTYKGVCYTFTRKYFESERKEDI